MFNENKYTNWYDNIISQAQLEKRYRRKRLDPKYIYYEQHHIIPRSLGGSDYKSNLVFLTAKEHYICHLLLVKMCIDPKHKQKMFCAINIYINTHGKKCNSKLYIMIRENVAKQLSMIMKGKPKTKESLEKMVKTRRKNNSYKHSDETKIKMVESHKLRSPQTVETRLKRSETMKGKPKTEKHKQAMRDNHWSRNGGHAWNKGLVTNDPKMINSLGRIVSNETRIKISLKLKGKKKSPEHIKKMSENAKKQWTIRRAKHRDEFED